MSPSAQLSQDRPEGENIFESRREASEWRRAAIATEGRDRKLGGRENSIRKVMMTGTAALDASSSFPELVA